MSQCVSSTCETLVAVSSWAPVVSGFLIGAASGIGGAVLGAWMNGRSQLKALRISVDAEDNRSKLADRRHLYALFISKANDLGNAVYSYSRPAGKNKSQIESERIDLEAARKSVLQTANEIILVAPADVVDAVSEMYDNLITLYDKACDGMREIDADETTSNLAVKSQEIMRRDLNP